VGWVGAQVTADLPARCEPGLASFLVAGELDIGQVVIFGQPWAASAPRAQNACRVIGSAVVLEIACFFQLLPRPVAGLAGQPRVLSRRRGPACLKEPITCGPRLPRLNSHSQRPEEPHRRGRRSCKRENEDGCFVTFAGALFSGQSSDSSQKDLAH
jgi:hypothetical protein